MKPTLLILAAGMGNRYGGLKQIDPIGPNGEIIIDYSIYDAIRAGFASDGGGEAERAPRGGEAVLVDRGWREA